MIGPMRARYLVIAAAVATASPALSADLSGGFVPPVGDPLYSPQSIVFGHLSLGLGGFDGSSVAYFGGDALGVVSGVGRANVPLGNGWNVEFETGGKALFKDGSSFTDFGVAGHVWTKLNSAAVGVYGGINFPFGTTVYTAGVEGEVYFGSITLGADADYNWSECPSCGNFWSVGGWADFYFNPDFRISGSIDYGAGDIPDLWSAGIDTEYRFSGSPLSVWAEGSYSSIDCCGAPDIWEGLAGFRFFLDPPGTTLQEHDRQVPWQGLLRTRLAF
jgi:hypothetical protein